MRPPNFALEDEEQGIVAGLDEAGRGPWAGPVVAAAVILPRKKPRLPHGINDSKRLNAAQREEIFAQLQTIAAFGIGVASREEIDAMNILRASMLAMERAFLALSATADCALVDGNYAPTLPCRIRTVIRGDSLSLSIAAASIIAKVTRDNIMRELAGLHPGYGWETNAGYGTRAHQKAIARFGLTTHHRRSFAPIRAIQESTQCSVKTQECA